MVVRKTLVWAPVERELCPHQQGGVNSHHTGFLEDLGSGTPSEQWCWGGGLLFWWI